MSGFPVEVALYDTDHIKHREVPSNPRAHSDTIYSFTLEPDTNNSRIWCDSTGARAQSIAWGIVLDPVPINHLYEQRLQSSALYIETTGEELRDLIGALQNLYDVNYDEDGRLRE